MTKTKRKRDDVLTKRDEVLINRDNINAKRKEVINLFDETMINEANEKKNDDAEFKQKKEKLINFEIMTTAGKKEMMIKKKISIENDNFQMFEILDVKNSTERILMKYHIDDTTSILNFFETLTFDIEIFLK